MVSYHRIKMYDPDFNSNTHFRKNQAADTYCQNKIDPIILAFCIGWNKNYRISYGRIPIPFYPEGQ